MFCQPLNLVNPQAIWCVIDILEQPDRATLLIKADKPKEKKMKSDKEQELWLLEMSGQPRQDGPRKAAFLAAIAAVGVTTASLVSG